MDNEALLAQLNEPQREAVLHKDGPMLIIAGAGSGKTRVLTLRIARLVQLGVDPFNILSLTFTNKAAREMKARIAGYVGKSEAKNLWMGTFHSVFAKILRIEGHQLGFPSNFTIYDSQDSQRLITSIIKEMQLDKDVYKTKQVLNRISSFKNSLITVHAYKKNYELQEADAMAKKPRMGAIYQAYVDRCFKAGAMDFDDLLLRTNELLTRFPKVLAKYQDRFRYIMVDEYQDTNHSQYLIVRALADRFQNICVVGDDSQSIYAFRGANISNILNFQKDYSDVATFKLEQNYRSTSNIVEAANSVIENNKTKLEKVIWTSNDAGEKIKVARTMTDAEEGRFVISQIFETKMQNQLLNSDFAILYRTNAQSRAMEDALRKRDIPYRIYGGLSFYQRKEIKDVLAYHRLIINSKDEEALRRVINYPARGIGQTTMAKLIVAANDYNVSIFDVLTKINELNLSINAGTRAKINQFVTLIRSFQALDKTYDAFEITEHVIKHTGLLVELKKDATPEGIGKMQNVEELLNGMKDFVEGQKEVPEMQGKLSEFMEDVALATDLDKDTGDDDRVSLMTIHLSKGLEFSYVYIVGMEEDLFPSAMSMNTREDLEEERRLFYVAITRAEKQAMLTYTLSRYRWGKLIDAEPSRFIEEIDEKYIEYLTPKEQGRFNPMLDASLFGEVDKSKFRLKKPVGSAPPTFSSIQGRKLRKIKPVASGTKTNLFDNKLTVGNKVKHARFGTGVIVRIEGKGADTKAEINFSKGGLKNLLLRFAKLEVIG